VCHEVISQDRKIGNRSVDHRGKRTLAVLCNDDIATPCNGLSKRPPLNLSDALVDGKGHPVTRNDGIENDVRLRKLLVHSIKRLDKMIMPCARTKTLCDVVHIDLRVWHLGWMGAMGSMRVGNRHWARHERDHVWVSTVRGEEESFKG